MPARSINPSVAKRVFLVVMLLALSLPASIRILGTLAPSQAGSAEPGSARTGLVEPGLIERLRSRGELERRLEDTSPIVRLARRAYAPWLDELANRGNHKVIFGRSNWLFFREAVEYVTGASIDPAMANVADGDDPAAVIVDLDRQLRASNIDLLVVPAPVKATLHPERLWAGIDDDVFPNNAGYDAFIDRLRAAGVQVVDLTAPMIEAKRRGRAMFLARDTHWTPEGLGVAVETIAEAAMATAIGPSLASETSVFDRREVLFEGRGDLYDMLPYATWRRFARPMRFAVEQVIATEDGRGPISRGAPILLLGDSLTNVYSDPNLEMGQRGGLAERLAARLGQPIDVIAMPAGGATRSRRAWALRPAPLAGKRLVIWVFTQRDLLFSADGWQRVTLPTTERVDIETKQEETTYDTVAWLRETTRLPAALDYADCLIVSRFRWVDGDRPGADRSIDVVHWGVRDWKPTKTSKLRSKALYRLKLRPLPPDLDLESTCWYDEVGLTRQPLWAESMERQ